MFSSTAWCNESTLPELPGPRQGPGSKDLHSPVKRLKPSLAFLSETKLSSFEMLKVLTTFEGYTGVAVDSRGQSRGVAMFWLNTVDMALLSLASNHIDMTVKWRNAMIHGYIWLP